MDQQLPNPLPDPTPSNIYPTISISLIQNPSRLWAFPLLGGLAKVIILIPVAIWLGLVSMYAGILVVLNSFVVLFTGKYWAYAYSTYLGALRLQTKSGFFFMGLTDRYPGFGLSTTDFSLDIPYPETSSRLFAIPFLGFLARITLLIPFFIWSAIIQSAILLGGFVLAPWVVLFTGKYPESIYELVRDGQRISLAQSFYISGISDKYPNFWISFNHQIKKVLLLVFGSGLVFASLSLPSPDWLINLEKELRKGQETSTNTDKQEAYKVLQAAAFAAENKDYEAFKQYVDLDLYHKNSLIQQAQDRIQEGVPSHEAEAGIQGGLESPENKKAWESYLKNIVESGTLAITFNSTNVASAYEIGNKDLSSITLGDLDKGIFIESEGTVTFAKLGKEGFVTGQSVVIKSQKVEGSWKIVSLTFTQY